MITILKPSPNDAEGINEVIKLSWYATYINPEIGITKEDIDLMYEKNEKQQIETFRRRAEHPKDDDISFVAKESEKVLGFVRLVILGDHIRVRTFYVHPNYMGKGIGTSLWNEALKYLPQNKPVVAWPAEHTKSIDFYKKIGFVYIGEKHLEEEAMESSGIHMSVVKMILNR